MFDMLAFVIVYVVMAKNRVVVGEASREMNI